MSGQSPALLDPPTLRSEPTPKPQALWHRYHKKADATAESELVQQYLPLVKAVVGRVAMTLPSHVDFNDLHSAGLVGLLAALRNYDPTCGSGFGTYARVRIRGAVLDELRRMDWVPRSVHEKARRIEQTMAALEQKLGTTPTEAQMARALKLTPAEYERWLDEVRPSAFICLDAVYQTEAGEASSLHELIEDDAQVDPVEQASRQELKALIARRLNDLPDVQRKVLALYYLEDLRLSEIAAVFGVTESRICQIHAQAILAIRSFLNRYEAGVERPTGPAREP